MHIPALLPTSTSIFEKTFSGPLPGSLGNVTKQYSDPPPAIAIDQKNQETSVEGVFVYRSESLVMTKTKDGWLDWAL